MRDVLNGEERDKGRRRRKMEERERKMEGEKDIVGIS